MSNATDNFEIFLRGALKDASADAPPAPSPFVLRRRLRRRGLARALWGSVAAALMLAAAIALPGLMSSPAVNVQTARGPSHRPPVVKDDASPKIPPVSTDVPVPDDPEPEIVPELAAAFEPLSETGDFALLQEALTDYFTSRGIRRAEITKRPGAEIDFVLNATGVVDFAQVALDFETLLKNHDRVGISFREGLVACWLAYDMQS